MVNFSFSPRLLLTQTFAADIPPFTCAGQRTFRQLLGLFGELAKNEGVLSLWKGNSAAVTRVASKVISVEQKNLRLRVRRSRVGHAFVHSKEGMLAHAIGERSAVRQATSSVPKSNLPFSLQILY